MTRTDLCICAWLWEVSLVSRVLSCIAAAQQPVAHHYSALGW